jgi:transporter family protein
LVFLLALLGTFCWGLAPLFGKLGLAQTNPLTALALRTFYTGVVLAGWFGFTRGIAEFRHLPPKIYLFIAFEALLATILGDLAYFSALKIGNLNDVTMIMSTSPMVTLVLSHFFLGEQIYAYQVVGILLIVAGLVLVGLQPKF